jgi:hypothetical protein
MNDKISLGDIDDGNDNEVVVVVVVSSAAGRLDGGVACKIQKPTRTSCCGVDGGCGCTRRI